MVSFTALCMILKPFFEYSAGSASITKVEAKRARSSAGSFLIVVEEERFNQTTAGFTSHCELSV